MGLILANNATAVHDENNGFIACPSDTPVLRNSDTFSGLFPGGKHANNLANNFFAKKACNHHIWGYTGARLPTKWGLRRRW